MGGKRHAAALLLYLGLTIVLTWPMAAQAMSAIPGDSFDGWQNAWNLWWMRVAVVERVQSPFFTDLLYYPTGVSLLFHTLNPLNGLISMPVQLAFGVLAAYNFVVVASFTLSGYGAFLLAAWVLRPLSILRPLPVREESAAGARFWAALLAGAIFAFAPVHMAQLLGHMQVFAYEWIPFAVLFMLRTVTRARAARPWLRDALLCALFVVLAALCDWYFALYLLLFGAFALIWAIASGLVQRASLRDTLRPALALGVAGVVSGVLLAPLAIQMANEALHANYMVRPARDLYIYSVSAVDFLIPSRMHPLLASVAATLPGSQVGPISERTVAVGWLTLGLVVASILVARRRAFPWLAATLFFALLALGPRMHWGNITPDQIPDNVTLSGWAPYTIVNALVPFMRISRSVSRFAIMVELCLAVAAAAGFAGLLSRRPGWASTAGVIALAILLAEFWVAPYPMSAPDTPDAYRELAAMPADPARPALLNLPMNYDRPGYLWYQTVHGRPLTVGYISRDDPRTLTERVPVLQQLRHLGPDIIDADLGAVGLTVLNDLGVGVVTLDRYKMPGGDEREVTEAIAHEIFADIKPVHDDDRLTVYKAPAVSEPAGYLRLGDAGWGPLESVDGARARKLAESGAGIEALHAAPGARVAVRYRGDGSLRTKGGAIFPPAPDGGEAVIDLAGEPALWLVPEGGDVWIERLSLVEE